MVLCFSFANCSCYETGEVVDGTEHVLDGGKTTSEAKKRKAFSLKRLRKESLIAVEIMQDIGILAHLSIGCLCLTQNQNMPTDFCKVLREAGAEALVISLDDILNVFGKAVDFLLIILPPSEFPVDAKQPISLSDEIAAKVSNLCTIYKPRFVVSKFWVFDSLILQYRVDPYSCLAYTFNRIFPTRCKIEAIV